MEEELKEMDNILKECQLKTLKILVVRLKGKIERRETKTEYQLGVIDGIQESINYLSYHIDQLK